MSLASFLLGSLAKTALKRAMARVRSRGLMGHRVARPDDGVDMNLLRRKISNVMYEEDLAGLAKMGAPINEYDSEATFLLGPVFMLIGETKVNWSEQVAHIQDVIAKTMENQFADLYLIEDLTDEAWARYERIARRLVYEVIHGDYGKVER